MRHFNALTFVALLNGICPHLSFAAGPDVIVGFVDDGREDSRLGGRVGLTASTNACNIGDVAANWIRLPDARHPVITLNFYRMMDGRIEQLAKSWVKHGYFATNHEDCRGVPEMVRTCEVGTGGNQLRPGCSDYYGEDLNARPGNLGPRSRITDPTAGKFDGTVAQDLTGYPASQPAERILLVNQSDLGSPGARYFVEAQYIVSDDSSAGNSRNNVTYREVQPILRSGAWVLKNVAPEVRGMPAIVAWKQEGAQLSELETAEVGGKSYVIIASKANPLPGGKYRYDYAVYNMNSDLAIQALRVPAAGVDPASIKFKAVMSNGEIWSNEPWQHRVDQEQVIWETKTYSEDRNANAIRWGSTYNFSFESSAPPGTGDASIVRYKPAPAAVGDSAVTPVVVPGTQ